MDASLVVPQRESLELVHVSEGGADHRADIVPVETQLAKTTGKKIDGLPCTAGHDWIPSAPVEPVKVLVDDVGEAVAAEVEEAEAGEAPERADADVGHLRVGDDERLQQPEVLEVGTEAQLVLKSLRHRALKFASDESFITLTSFQVDSSNCCLFSNQYI